jgi:hypothetical protein
VLTDASLLRAAYLRPPQATRVAQRLADLGVAPNVLTVDELYQQVAAVLAARAVER